jgi:hypothetical protein
MFASSLSCSCDCTTPSDTFSDVRSLVVVEDLEVGLEEAVERDALEEEEVDAAAVEDAMALERDAEADGATTAEV